MSLDQVAVIAQRAGHGSDEHYAQLVSVATVSQLRTAVKLEPRPDPDPRPGPQPAITKTTNAEFDFWRITLPHAESAKFAAALQSHRDALLTEWTHDRNTNTNTNTSDTSSGDSADSGGSGGGDNSDSGSAGDSSGGVSGQHPPIPTNLDAFLRLVEHSWDTEVGRRPHGQHTTVIAHVDVDQHIGALHLGPLLSESERQYLTCDATCQVWFERAGEVIGAGRTTRTINRQLRRTLEHRHRSCAVPGCAATRGLHAHHIQHWENGGTTDPDKVGFLCRFWP